MHNIHAGGIKKKWYINMSHGRIIHILFYEQALWGRGKKKNLKKKKKKKEKKLTWQVLVI